MKILLLDLFLNNSQPVPKFMKERGIPRIIIEKGLKFCLYMPKVNPLNMADMVKDVSSMWISPREWRAP